MRKWLEKLSSHFNTELDKEQLNIFVDALARSSDYQIETAFERCLNELQFMPKLREVHEKMPEQREEPKLWSAARTTPTLELVRPYARAAAQQLFGKKLEEIEGAQLMKAFFYGSRARYEDMGIDTSRWTQWDDGMEKLLEIGR